MNTENEQVSQSEDSLGQRLKRAREEAGWSEEEVAKRLKLRICVIQSLEKNDYDFGIPNTYVQGYLKNYARLVGLSEEIIRPTLDSLKTIPSPLKITGRTDASTKSRSTTRPLTYLVSFMLLTIFVLIWQMQASKSPLPSSPLEKSGVPSSGFLSKPDWPTSPLQNSN